MHTRPIRTWLLPAAGLALTAFALTACSSANGVTGTSSNGPSSAGQPNAGSEQGPGATGHGGFGNFAAATGKATAVSGSGVKVATSSGTTVVAWATSTRFTRVTNGSRSSVAIGDCVTVSSGSPRSSASPSPTASVTATSVTVTSTSACAARRGFSRGGPAGVRPSGAPTPAPGRSPGAGGRGGFQGGRGGPGGFGGFGVTGTVTRVSAGQIVLKTLGFGSSAAISRTVTMTAKTTYRVSSTATATAVTKGQCVAAIGSKGSDGTTLDALSITVSSPTGGTCPATTLAGGFGGGGFAGGGGGTPPEGGTNA